MADGAGRYRAGETALIVKVPEAEPVVGGWRERFDPSAEAGVPAHVSVLYPFLNQDHIGDQVLGAVAELFGSHGAFDLRFATCGRFPGVLYLAPEPDDQFRALTLAVAARWPEAPPYGGRFAEVIPHLTVADGQEPSVLDTVEADLARRLPVATHVSSVQLLVFDGIVWREQADFALRAPRISVPRRDGQR
ncbi:2'-5' RNA ligase family protein [Actinacidiphila glaucinigra]|uniref:2'-5' RNA ligase superfamily protein n=1 Tax=Actinacidiphila glaucinigra TaxID=235986 RepID=A0A239NCF9_9ACTN|nr:2'-5' RNA ligase family protein [Actinacidiphila glaucinigra]SNT51859.1 2'-5' RNA ligase superfamily protein [Actinacidiphila glaucinigra]